MKCVKEAEDLELILLTKGKMDIKLIDALSNEIWSNHNLGDVYEMDGVSGWRMSYYPIFEDGKTGKEYLEPRVLVERQFDDGRSGTDFREIPIRFIKRIKNNGDKN